MSKIQLFVKAKSDQVQIPDPHGPTLKPMRIRNSVKIIRVLKLTEIYDAVVLTGCNPPPLVPTEGYEHRDFIFHELQAKKSHPK
jgi:hypothetical protein